MKHETNNKSISLKYHNLNWLENTTILLGLWFIIYPSPYELLLGLLVFIPILGLALNGFDKKSVESLVEIKFEKGKTSYDVVDFIDIAALAIFIRCFRDFELDNFYALIIPGTITFISIITLLFSTHKGVVSKNKKISSTYIYLHLIFFIFIYSYGATCSINCAFDCSSPEVFKTKIVDKHISRGKHTSYFIKVAPWGHHLDRESIRVSRNEYESFEIESTVEIDLKDGLLGIPWFYVRK